jgi:NADH:ubiquinone reductase (H+-translocating)
MNAMSERRKVVVIGGGWGGLSAAQHLNSNLVDVTLIDRRNYHLFQLLLYQVATGSLSPGEIASPLLSTLSRQKNTRVWLGIVVDVDPDLKRVIPADGTIVPYDSLIIAAGSETSYFGHNDWQQWAPGLKSIEEATTIRHKILYAFEVAERIPDPERRRAWLTFVIVGAGAERRGTFRCHRRDRAPSPEERLPLYQPGRSADHTAGWWASGNAVSRRPV